MTLKLVLSLTALALIGATDAMAATSCPRGQFFRVSKQSCIDRNEAVKLGILHGAAPAASAPQAGVEPTREPAQDATTEPAPAPSLKPPHARKIAHAPKAKPARHEPAPDDQELAATPEPAPVPTVRPPESVTPTPAEKTASPFGVLDTANVPVPQR